MFDPYRKWLGIQSKDQPPNHYRLLSLDNFENDLDVIEGAADRQMGFIRQYQAGEHAASAAKLLNEIATARLCLLKPKLKADYDAKLKKQLAVSKTTTEEIPSFEVDAEMAELMQAPKLERKSKRKKSKTPQGLWVAGGIGVVVCVLTVGLLMSSGRKVPAKHSQPDEDVLAESKPSSASIKSPTVNSKQPPNLSSSGTAPPTIVSVITPSPSPATKNNTPTESKAADDAIGPSIDLMKEVNSQLDSIYKWLPVKVPVDYRLTFSVTRISGDAIWFGFVAEGRQGVVVFDSGNSKFSGLYVDASKPDSNCTSFPGPIFKNDIRSTVILTVHPGHFQASVDGKTIVDWYGRSDRLSYFSTDFNFAPNHELPFIRATPGSYQISSAELIAIKPEANRSRVDRLSKPVDLMSQFDMSRDVKKGVWTMSQNLLLSGDKLSQIQIPVDVPEEYTLSATIVRPNEAGGDSQLNVGLVAGSSMCQVIAFSDKGLGLDMISANQDSASNQAERWFKNETFTTGNRIKPATPANVAFTVTKQGIRYDLNGRTLLDWRGDYELLGLPPGDYLTDARRLFLASHSRYIVRDLKIGPPSDPPVLPDLPKGRPVDLLAIIDPDRDAITGTWVKDGAALRTMGDAEVSKLAFPCEVPSEYRLTVRVAREKGGANERATLLLKLPVDSFMAQVFLDANFLNANQTTMSGVEYDYISVSDPKNVSVSRIPVVPLGPVHELVIEVRRSGVKVTKGQKAIIDWSGHPFRFVDSSYWRTPARRISFGSPGGRFRFEKLKIEPLEPSSNASVPKLDSDGNLLAIIDPIRDSRAGDWKLDSNGLIAPKMLENVPWVAIQTPVPERYELTAVVERNDGEDELIIGMVIDGKPCAAGFDRAKGTRAGLMRLDGMAFYHFQNPTCRNYKSPLLPLGQRVTIRCFVLPDSVIVNCGDKEVLRWHGDARRFSPFANGFLPRNHTSVDREHLWLGAFQAGFIIHELKLKPLSDDETARISASFSGVFPTESQTDVTLKDAFSIIEAVAPTVPAN